MPHGKMIVRPFVFALLVAVCTIAWGQSPPNQTIPEGPQKASLHSGPTIVGEFQRNEVESAQDQVHRQMREEKFARLRTKPLSDPGKLVDGKSETTGLLIVDYVIVGSKDPKGLPASDAAAVVIATVLSGKCYITSDHTYVYTDYKIRIDEVVKQDPKTILTMGDQVVASRSGGAIHFPSGHVTHVLTSGHGLPVVGSQYVFFLSKSNPEFPEYIIMFPYAYELKDNHVFPLDDANFEYDNMSASEFLDLTRKAIAAHTAAPSPQIREFHRYRSCLASGVG